MSFTYAKEHSSAMELKRFAAAFLHTKDILSAVDWDTAALDFDPSGKVKRDSFRTFVTKAHKAIRAGAGVSAASDLEVKRFAAALLNLSTGNTIPAVDWDKAALDYDPTGKAKTASFRTYVTKAANKIKANAGTVTATTGDAAEDGVMANGKGTVKEKGKRGAKRKADAEAGEEDEQPKAKKGRAKKGAKVDEQAAEEGVEEAGEEEEQPKVEKGRAKKATKVKDEAAGEAVEEVAEEVVEEAAEGNVEDVAEEKIEDTAGAGVDGLPAEAEAEEDGEEGMML